MYRYVYTYRYHISEPNQASGSVYGVAGNRVQEKREIRM